MSNHFIIIILFYIREGCRPGRSMSWEEGSHNSEGSETESQLVNLGGQRGLLPRADKHRFQPPVPVRERTGSGPEQMHHQASLQNIS